MSRNKYPEETIKRILDVSEALFLEKGYDNTSIKDIIDGLGGLSKGAIYHHFASKEDIFDAVNNRFNEKSVAGLRKICSDDHLTGFEKLKVMFDLSLSAPDRDFVFIVAPKYLDNPKLLAIQIKMIFDDVVPHYVEPVVREGIEDGSIQTDYPKELSEMMILLTNLWLNPLVMENDIQALENRIRFLMTTLNALGLPIIDERMVQAYKRYCSLVEPKEVTTEEV